MFVPLHVKSHFSAGEGTATVEELVAAAAARGTPALALTDVENLYGQVRFHHAARAAGLKAISGVELRAGHGPHRRGRREGRLVLLARDETGYRALCRIVSRRAVSAAAVTPPPLASIGDDDLEGLFLLSDDPATLAALRAFVQDLEVVASLLDGDGRRA
jgi:DNA polymerase III alpha subunit